MNVVEGDGNIHALNEYLNRVDDVDAAYEKAEKEVRAEVSDAVDKFTEALTELHSAIDTIESIFSDSNIYTDDENIFSVLGRCANEEKLETMLDIDC